MLYFTVYIHPADRPVSIYSVFLFVVCVSCVSRRIVRTIFSAVYKQQPVANSIMLYKSHYYNYYIISYSYIFILRNRAVYFYSIYIYISYSTAQCIAVLSSAAAGSCSNSSSRSNNFITVLLVVLSLPNNTSILLPPLTMQLS